VNLLSVWFAGAVVKNRECGLDTVYECSREGVRCEEDVAVWTNGLGVTRRGWV
jgi:hypothetical protein